MERQTYNNGCEQCIFMQKCNKRDEITEVLCEDQNIGYDEEDDNK